MVRVGYFDLIFYFYQISTPVNIQMESGLCRRGSLALFGYFKVYGG